MLVRVLFGSVLPVLLLAGGASVLLWLNRSPWWGWALVAVLLAALGVGVSRIRRRVLAKAGVWLVGVVAVLGAAVLAFPPAEVRVAGGSDPIPTEQVITRDGPVQGVLNDARSVDIFAGVPYAQPPIGDLRWRAPEPVEPREDVLVADRFSAVPIQGASSFATRALSQVVEAPLESTLLNPYPVSEDSLSLNIWRSAAPGAEAMPVLVYIPGGGFQTGSGALPLYDGEALAERGGIITVTVNYRLGVFGFLAHPDLAANAGDDASANFGILDQIAALEWVRDNIAAFGGDPERVTIAGESAGGENVCILGATPLAEGLIDGIIGGSGACMGTTGDTDDGDQFDTRQAAEEAGRRLSEKLGGASIEEMRAMPVDRIRDAAAEYAGHWRPHIDGRVLVSSPAEIYAAGEQHDVPLLVGSNADEASLVLAAPPELSTDEYESSARATYGALADRYLELYPGESPEQALESTLRAQTDSVMTRAMLRWARLQTETGEADAYLYFFSHTPPEPGLEKYGAYHGAEVGYAYDNLPAVGDLDVGPADRRLRDEMSTAWLAFVHRGVPHAPGVPSWDSVEQSPDEVMEFSTAGGAMGERPRAEAVDFWLTYPGPIP